MQKQVKRLIQNTLAFGPIPRLMQKFRDAESVTILTYHGIVEKPLPFDDWCFLDKQRFEQQIRYLSRHFNLVSMTEACNVLSGKQPHPGGKPLAVITFDDGYQNNYDIALPILEKYDAPATIYLVSELVATERNFWFTRLLQALCQTRKTEIIWHRRYPLLSATDKARSSSLLQRALKDLPATEIDKAIEQLEQALDVSPQQSVPTGSPFRMLDQASLDALLQHPLIEFGAHTHSHHILSQLNSTDKHAQIARSVESVRELTGESCQHFAFPNGAPQDYDQESIDLLKGQQIHSAVTMSPGPARPGDDMLRLKRYPIGTDTRFPRFKLMVHHIV
ncbi:polysaccharide deacetylase family protein [Marinobacterium jannaschii]|uniref:polysaccharide deacetylase family protein n=1 Tax=Marinobacterium jannaschii TaxID=64970 RepID=UPI00047F7C8E|nr:polysaccharide deacetylase family protein [Marinobacterium jannaschii]